jgi:hypothetical protein
MFLEAGFFLLVPGRASKMIRASAHPTENNYVLNGAPLDAESGAQGG